MLLHHLQFDEEAALHAASVCSDGARQAAILESSVASQEYKDNVGDAVVGAVVTMGATVGEGVGAAARQNQRRFPDTQHSRTPPR
jgi:hypothetical protein